MTDAQTPPATAQVIAPVVDLCRAPDGTRDRQMIFGDTLVVLGHDGDWQHVQADKDGYCGHVKSSQLGPVSKASHKVTALATHIYERPDIKSPNLMSLSFGSRLDVTGQTGKFAQTALGFVPLVHLVEVEKNASDPAAIADLFLDTPYLWGGNSRLGIDCSGLVQAALLACNIPCPGDSGDQHAIGAPASGPFQRNDLLLWKGHVAIVVDPDTLIHANAHAMSVAYEPINDAIQRIESQGDGPVTAHRRL